MQLSPSKRPLWLTAASAPLGLPRLPDGAVEAATLARASMTGLAGVKVLQVSGEAAGEGAGQAFGCSGLPQPAFCSPPPPPCLGCFPQNRLPPLSSRLLEAEMGLESHDLAVKTLLPHGS